MVAGPIIFANIQTICYEKVQCESGVSLKNLYLEISYGILLFPIKKVQSVTSFLVMWLGFAVQDMIFVRKVCQ